MIVVDGILKPVPGLSFGVWLRLQNCRQDEIGDLAALFGDSMDYTPMDVTDWAEGTNNDDGLKFRRVAQARRALTEWRHYLNNQQPTDQASDP